MAIPAYLWITDESGSPIRGASEVKNREGSIEILGFCHGVHGLADANTGALTGTRSHAPMVLEKEFDCTSPLLYRAVAKGVFLKTAEIKWYRIEKDGVEREYFNMKMEDVRVVSVAPRMHHVKNASQSEHNHCEVVELRYRSPPDLIVPGSAMKAYGIVGVAQ